MAARIPISEKNRKAISEYLFQEGVCFAKKYEDSTKHPEIDAPNSEVIKLMKKFKSDRYVNDISTRMHYYWYLTYDGIEFLRTYLNLPSDIVPATLKKSAGGPPGDRPRDQIEDAMKMAIKIEGAIKIVCESHNIQFSKVWIASWDKNQIPLSTRAFNLTSFVASQVLPYVYFAHMVFLNTGESLVEKTLEDHEPRFFRMCDIYPETSSRRINKTKVNVLVICLKSIDSGDICYAFEFIWDYNSKSGISLEDLLLTLKRCLPSFKFASGAELGDELHVIDVENSTRFKIFKGKQVSLVQGSMEGPKPVVVGDTTPSKAKCKAAPVDIPREKKLGHTMKEAAHNLEVSPSTLKRKCKEHERPQNLAKRKVNQSRNQSDTNEEDSEAILVPPASEKFEDILTIKAEYSDDMIKFDLLMSDATFVIIEREIGKGFKLTPGTYKLKYCDEDSDWILLTSEQDMIYCIRSSKRLDRTVVRLRVLPSA